MDGGNGIGFLLEERPYGFIGPRGVKDILIACTDNLKGFTDAIKGVFPDTVTQRCAVHQIRNSCKYVVWKDRKAFCADLKAMYAAVNREAAEIALEKLDDKWDINTGMLLNPGETTGIASNYFDFPMEIRKRIYHQYHRKSH